MVNPALIRAIVGIIGNIISFGLFISPVPTFAKIIKQKSVGEFRPDPCIATLLNCALWSFGCPNVHPDSLLVLTINGTGLRNIIIALLAEAALFAILLQIRSMIIGILCIVLNIIIYASSLTVMKMVIKTKSVKYMPFSLSFANFCNGIVWSIYAAFLKVLDPYILFPKALGSLSGEVQLILYATYYKTTNWDEDDEKPKSDVQISNV
ncbi:bidirectional sugar transporter SWEET5-like [Pyrus ussuriensis x Pyrus communis]|uniref:Bidirectional sugar transporter SWEET5-like n=1 Tax=Pyrus ussuriensis x Pyrus communis TaxID=2448454 RepID=A0A5N5GHU3_9ROSA|nr:bidirectional sugar transporter SWEET5-like [Pyrus ussuriensis x Pyrus communis]